MMPRRRPRARLALAALLGLAACFGPGEEEVRAEVSRWFVVGEPQYFKSTMNCTAAALPLRQLEPRAALQLQDDIPRALHWLEQDGVMALRLEGRTPDQAFIDVMNAKRSVGVHVQSAALNGKQCMDAATEGAFRAALTNPQAIFVWDRAKGAVVLMDPDQELVFWASGAP